MSMNETGGIADADLVARDLGPLAWVLDELRRSVDSALKSLRRYVREVDVARGTDLASVDAGQLRTARQQLHQAAGALDMVGQPAGALVLRAMESAVQQFVRKPEKCTDSAVGLLAQASFALIEYLDGVLGGRALSSVALFPQFRDVQQLAGSDRIHPADLWPLTWRWIDPAMAIPDEPAAYALSVRTRIDQGVLQVMKSGDAAAAASLAALSRSLARAQTERQPAVFWKLCAAFFEALSLGLIPADVYLKRAAARVLLQYAALAKGELDVSERLAQDLLFFCSQALPADGQQASALQAVRVAYNLGGSVPVDYESRRFGRFDPAALAQARKRIDALKESWAALSGGDQGRLRSVVDQVSLVVESLVKLHPASGPLGDALNRAAEQTLRSGKQPGTELAMEVATAVLYLEAVFDDLDPNDPVLAERTLRLANRLEQVCDGGTAQPLESWMEELYRRVSDRQTMGTVVGELRSSLNEAEKALDQFFRQPSGKAVLNDVPGVLSQMRGVLSVLGLDQASQAVLAMRDSVEQILAAEVDEERARAAGTFDKLGNSLGALGFLIDMLNYQPALAKKLFVFDAKQGELRLLMGYAQPAENDPALAVGDRLSSEVRSVVQEATAAGLQGEAGLPLQLDALAAHAALADQPELARSAREAAQALAVSDTRAAEAALSRLSEAAGQSVPEPVRAMPEPECEEDDLRDIFLAEAREVIQGGIEAVRLLRLEPRDIDQQTTLRRAFHTLKGSSRMVGLIEFGEAAWSMEQVLNAWLPDQKPMTAGLADLCSASLDGFSGWVDDIASGRDQGWSAAPFRLSADAMRHENRFVPLSLPDQDAAPPLEAAEALPLELPELPELDLDLLDVGVEAPAPESAGLVAEELAEFDLSDFPQAGFAEPAQVEATPGPAAPALAGAEDVDWGLLAEVPGPAAVADDAVRADAAPVDAMPADEPPVAPVALEGVQATPEPDADVAGLSGEAEPLAVADVGPAPAVEPDEQVKVIDGLRIGIRLYNVFLNEADEWSRRLLTELTEWSMELHRPVPEAAEALAHSLGGSSATVGFASLSEMARALEHALQRVHGQAHGTPEQGRIFVDAAEDIRRLLHQFAAGFLKASRESVLQALGAVQPNKAVVPEAAVAVPQSGAEAVMPDMPASEAAELPVAAGPVATPPAGLPPMVRPSMTPHVPEAAVYSEQDEDIDLSNVIDADLFSVFEEEAAELLPQMGAALRQWVARPDNLGARAEVLRALHTLKGSARLAGALRLGEMAHRMESAIEAIRPDSDHPQRLEPLLSRLDALQSSFDALRQAGVAGLETLLPASVPDAVAPPGPLAEPVMAVPPVPARSVVVATTPLAPLRAASGQAVRVRSQLLDRLLNQAGEVMITRTRLEAEMGQLRGSLHDLTGNLDRLRQQLRDIELQAETQMQSRMAQAKDAQQNFDPLEFDRFTRVQELTRMMAESVNDVATVQRNLQRTVEATEDDLVAQARQTRELQRDLLRTRMVEFEGISERLYRVVRQASKDTGKQVKLDITGGSIEMDRGVLDRMTPAFEHLLRNCVAHGIEDPALRTNAGKNPVGSIVIDLHQSGNDVSVEFRDDGAGLDLARIRARAVQLALIPADQVLSDAEAADLIFMPGFTTANQVTELSGRGIGMDVVRAEVQALGGHIETRSLSGLGVAFKLVLPLTTAVTQVVMLRTGALSIGVPANLIEIVRRVTPAELRQAYETGGLTVGGESVPFFWSGALLQSSPGSRDPQARTLPVVIFRSAAQRVAVHVDEVLGNQEVVVKNLGPQLSRLPGLAGMTVLASGAVVLIYNPVALATVYGEQARQFSAAPAAPELADTTHRPGLTAAPSQVPLVLVVDDSITVRRVTQRLLQREGYRVALAADGLQALEQLQQERPTVVLSDIEMPRMDGFDLVRNIRHDRSLRDLPVIMITSRIAEKHREHARELGVNHYLGKPYSEEELLSLVRRYASTAVAA